MLVLGILTISAPFVLLLAFEAQARALATRLMKDFSVLQRRVFERSAAPGAPGDNGYQRLAELADRAPPDFGHFSDGSVSHFVAGTEHISSFPKDVRTKLATYSAWAESVRECAGAAELRWVEGLSPWTQRHPRFVRLMKSFPGLLELTAIEMRLLTDEGNPELALERCAATWALAADVSHLGMPGAQCARASVRILAPACGEALSAASLEERLRFSARSKSIRDRLAPPSEVIDTDRIATSWACFAWITEKETRALRPSPGLESRLRSLYRVRVGLIWRAYDRAMRRLIAVADSPSPERHRAAASAETVLAAFAAMKFEKHLRFYDQTFMLLELFIDLAAGGSQPLPDGVTRTEWGLEYVSFQSAPVLIPTPSSSEAEVGQ